MATRLRGAYRDGHGIGCSPIPQHVSGDQFATSENTVYITLNG